MSEASAALKAREPSAKYLASPELALLRGFELLATAPRGVPGLRQAILSLAVRGKLTAQSGSDEPAGKLSKRASEHAMSPHEGVIGKRFRPAAAG